MPAVKLSAAVVHRVATGLDYWVRVEDARPVKADYFLASGKHIKSATFDEFTNVNGMTMLRRMTIYDQMRKTSHTVLEFSSYASSLRCSGAGASLAMMPTKGLGRFRGLPLGSVTFQIAGRSEDVPLQGL